MPKTFLYLAAIALLGFIVTQSFWAQPKTWQPFYQGCMASAGAADQRCRCLTDFVHDRLDQAEIKAVMANRVVGASFQKKVEQTVQQGALSCR